MSACVAFHVFFLFPFSFCFLTFACLLLTVFFTVIFHVVHLLPNLRIIQVSPLLLLTFPSPPRPILQSFSNFVSAPSRSPRTSMSSNCDSSSLFLFFMFVNLGLHEVSEHCSLVFPHRRWLQPFFADCCMRSAFGCLFFCCSSYSLTNCSNSSILHYLYVCFCCPSSTPRFPHCSSWCSVSFMHSFHFCLFLLFSFTFRQSRLASLQKMLTPLSSLTASKPPCLLPFCFLDSSFWNFKLSGLFPCAFFAASNLHCLLLLCCSFLLWEFQALCFVFFHPFFNFQAQLLAAALIEFLFLCTIHVLMFCGLLVPNPIPS